MSNPFEKVSLGPAGPATDLLPVTPDDGVDLPVVASALYAEAGGTVVIDTLHGARTVALADYSYVLVAVRRVRATGTTATGHHRQFGVDTTDYHRSIDIRWLKREGLLESGISRSITWLRGGEIGRK